MQTKQGHGPISFKQDAQGEYTGEFTAVFATLNVVDHDGDVALPGAFQEGQKVRISAWGHDWYELPVGRGEIHADDAKAWVDGLFFLDTEAGKQTFLTVKNLGELQEWSYGFDVIERSEGKWGEGDGQDRDVRFLRKMDVIEISPVMLGAGIDTRTVDIKALRAGLKEALQGEQGGQLVQELHDMLIEMGAKCAHGDNAHASGGGRPTGQGGGQTPKADPQGPGPSTYAALVAIELMDDGWQDDGMVV